MKVIVILILIAVLVVLMAGPAMTIMQTQYEQARADRQAAEARMELARADAYAVRSQANQPVLVAITGLILVVIMVGGLAVVLASRRPAAQQQVQAQPAAPPPPITILVLPQLPGENRLDYLRRIETSKNEYAFPLVLDARPRVEVGRSLDRPAG